MTYLILGLCVFLGVHSVRIVADGWRRRMRALVGESVWRAGFGGLSVLGFLLMVWGYSLARQTPIQIWSVPMAMRHLSALLTLLAFVLLAASYVPANHIKARLRHPMVAAVTLWALAHLLANGNDYQIVLFGSFLVWSIFNFRAARQRDRLEKSPPLSSKRGATVITVALGVTLWLTFTLWLHGLLIGVRPFA